MNPGGNYDKSNMVSEKIKTVIKLVISSALENAKFSAVVEVLSVLAESDVSCPNTGLIKNNTTIINAANPFLFI